MRGFTPSDKETHTSAEPGDAATAARRSASAKDRDGVGGNRIALVFLAVALGLGIVSAVALFVPGVPYLIIAPAADLVIDTAAVVVAATVGVRAAIRYAETGESESLFQAAAFLTLLVGSLLRTGVVIAGQDVYAGFDPETPGQAPLYLNALKRSLGAVLLLLGATAALRGWRAPRPTTAMALLLTPALVVLIYGLLVLVNDPLLPVLVPQPVLERLLEPASVVDPSLITLPMAVLQLGGGGLFLAGALAYGMLARVSKRPVYTLALAAALLVAAFSQLYYTVAPGAYEGLVSAGDVLRLLFYLLVLFGVAAAGRRDLRDLVRANQVLARLRERDAERIALEERARLAREIHDGLVQELWLARLAHGRLRDLDGLPPEAERLAYRVDAILESALGEARQAVVALQASPTAGFGDLLRQAVEDYADRFGLDVECVIETEPPSLPERTASNLLRICREALANARKHADASLVWVRLRYEDGELRLVVQDNGRGFVPGQTRGGFGLRSMRERAETLDARLDIESAPMDGTRVTLVMPLAAEPARAQPEQAQAAPGTE